MRAKPRSSRRPAVPKAITIATNMAGRGTDIVLGGSIEKRVQTDRSRRRAVRRREEQAHARQLSDDWQALHDQVLAAGGLHIIGTERHESRRVDNQLRGRSGRQGDPGSSRFYLSLEDPLLRIFASDRVRAIMDRLKMPEGEAIEPHRDARDRDRRSARSKRATSTSASSCSNTTTSPTTSAR